MSRPVRHTQPDGKLGPPMTPRPRTIKKRHKGVGLAVVALIGYGVWAANRPTHHTTSTRDQSDLQVVAAASSVPVGGKGVVDIRLRNNGPDDLDHNITFTVSTSSQLVITGAGSVDENDSTPFRLDESCTRQPHGTLMTCTWFVEIPASGQNVWHVPVRVAAAAAPGTALRLNVRAVGNTTYTDPNTSNNLNVKYSVVARRAGTAPPRTTPPRTTPPRTTPPRTTPPTTRPPSSTPSPVPTRTGVAPVQPSSTKSPTSAGKRIRNAARDAVAPVTIGLIVLLGLVLLIVVTLVFVARRQRRLPLDYVPPRRDKSHGGGLSG